MLGADDLTAAAYPVGTVPDGLARDPVGRILAAPLRRGEPLTDAGCLTACAWSARLTAGTTAWWRSRSGCPTPARWTSSRWATASTWWPPTRGGGGARVVAAGVPVLALPRASDGPRRPRASPVALVVVGATPGSAAAIAEAAVQRLPHLHVRPVACGPADPRRSRAQKELP